jgi:hypothetical protein
MWPLKVSRRGWGLNAPALALPALIHERPRRGILRGSPGGCPWKYRTECLQCSNTPDTRIATNILPTRRWKKEKENRVWCCKRRPSVAR